MISFSNGHTEIVKLLLDQKGINFNIYNRFGVTALMNTSENGHIDIVKLLLEKEGINVNAVDDWEDRAHIEASSEGHTEIVKLFLEKEGININAKDKDGNYKIHRVAKFDLCFNYGIYQNIYIFDT